jgi:hypothetical protein
MCAHQERDNMQCTHLHAHLVVHIVGTHAIRGRFNFSHSIWHGKRGKTPWNSLLRLTLTLGNLKNKWMQLKYTVFAISSKWGVQNVTNNLRLVCRFLNLLLFLSIYKIDNTIAFPLQKKSIVQTGQTVFAIKTGPSRFLDRKIGPSRFSLSSLGLDCIWHDLQVIPASHMISPHQPLSIKGHNRLSKVQSHKP